jgi:hypothetical protein
MKRDDTEFNLVTIVETTFFVKESKKLIHEDEIGELKNYLATNPEVGDIVPGLRGIRKLRWQANQKGKRGGARVIYFFYNFDMPLFLLDIYVKSRKGDLSPSEKKELNNLVDELINEYGV